MAKINSISDDQASRTINSEPIQAYQNQIQQWMDKHYAFILASAHKHVAGLQKCEKSPDDFSIEVFIKLLDLPPEVLAEVKNPLPYLNKILKNLIIDKARTPDYRLRSDFPRSNYEIGPSNNCPFGVGTYEEMMEYLEKHLSPLLFVVLKKHLAGYRNKEIADQLGIKPGNVAKRLSHAKAEARSLLK